MATQPVIKSKRATDAGGIGTHNVDIQPASGDVYEVQYAWMQGNISCTAVSINYIDGTNVILVLDTDSGGAAQRTVEYIEHTNANLRQCIIDNSNYLRFTYTLTGADNAYYAYQAIQVADATAIPIPVTGRRAAADPGIGTHTFDVQPSAGDMWRVHYIAFIADAVGGGATAMDILSYAVDGTDTNVGLETWTGAAGANTLTYRELDNARLRRWFVDNGNTYIRMTVTVPAGSQISYNYIATKLID